MTFHSFLTPALLALAASVIPLHAQLLLTEINSNGAGGDFWELTNVGASPIDLSNYKWVDGGQAAPSASTPAPAAQTFPASMTIAAGETIVIITDTTVSTNFLAAWGPLTGIQKLVGGPGLGQNDSVRLYDNNDNLVFNFTYASSGFTRSNGSGAAGGHAGISAGGAATVSAVLDPNYPTSSPRYAAATAGTFGSYAQTGSPTTIGSPGVNGLAVAPPSITLTVSASPSSFSESAANPASSGTVNRTGSTAAALVVNLSSSDATEATVPATVTIPIGSASASFDITAVNDSFPDGNKSAIITASAPDSTAGTTTLTVNDDADVYVQKLLFTEVLSQQDASGANDFWELTNISAETVSLEGYSWHDSGRSASAAQAYKLPAGSSIAPGESVIFTNLTPAAFRTWWNIPNRIQVFQSAAPGLGQNDGVSFFDEGQNEIFFFSYAADGFTKSNGNSSTGTHSGPSAGAPTETQSAVWDPSSGTTSPRYTFASIGNLGAFASAASALDIGSPGATTAGAPAVSISNASIAEGNSGTTTLALNVTRSDTTTAFTVNFAVTGGTADGSDYSLAPGTLNFTANGPATLPINISVNGDTDPEDNETVIVTLSNLVNTTGATGLGTAVGTGTIVNDETATGTINLATYVRTGRYNLPEPTRTALPPGTAAHNLLCQEASAVTYNWDTDTLFISCDGGRSVTQVSKTGELIDTMSLELNPPNPQGTEFYDPEGITYIGNGEFVLSEERERRIVKFTYQAGATLTRAAAQTVDLGTFNDNEGTEGLSWDPQTSGFIVLKEKNPIGVFQTNVDFAAGTATNGSSTTENSINLFDPALLGMTDVADVFAFSNLPAMAGQPQEGNLLILGQEDARVVNISRSGVIASTLNINADPGDTINSPGMQHEGITMDRDGNIYIVNENGGGSIDFPQLWVYSPSTGENAAPTAVALNNAVTSLEENTSTASPVKLADIAVTDDGLGTNQLSLTGADAASFEITGSALYLKAGVTLDFETKTSYAVTVNVDDISLGTTPDASVNFTLTVTDQVVESSTVAVAVTEVAPWASSNSPVADDWFEITNITSNPVTITGWKVDDSSNSFGSAAALNGVTTLAPGQSAVFLLEVTAAEFAAKSATFINTWFSGSAPSGFLIGYVDGGGLGLGSGGDAVNIFNASGILQANVSFGASDAVSPYQTFDNTLAVTNAAVTLLSEAGINGAFTAPNSAEIGSPGFATPGLLRVTEVAPWSSGNSPVGADWFEVTNFGARAVNINGWKVNDSSESPAAALALNGIASIAPGESVIFIETNDLTGKATLFKSNWFGPGPPPGLQIGSYSGSGIGLSTGGDAVNLYDTNNVRQVSVAFGIAPSAAPFTTFDNAAAINVGTVTQFSAVGTNGAFTAIGSPIEVGSPGTIVNPPAVDFTLQLLHLADAEAGLLASQTAPNLAALVDAFDGTYPNTLILAGGDNFIPGPFLSAGTDPLVAATHTRGNNPAAADIEIHNRLGVEASTIGNHEFDLGTNAFSDAILDAAFPYLSANLDFSGDSGISARYLETVGVGGLEETSTLAQRIVPSAVVTKNGQKIGLVGATTQIVESISSTGGVEVKGFAGDGSEVDNMALLASQLQPVIADLKSQGVNKIILMAHLQQIANEQTLAPLLTDVDIILAAGSNTRLGDANDVPVAFPGHAANFAANYPIYTAGADGKPTVIVNTDNEFTYLGRLVANFDANGEIIVPNQLANSTVNGAYAATAANVAAAWGISEANLAATAFAPGTKGAGVKQITDAVQGVINAKDGDVRSFTNVYLEGERNFVRNQETNLGNISADSMITVGETALPANKFVAALKNGGGIRAQIGAVDVVTGAKLPPLANPAAGKPAGGISLLDIENSMRFNNGLMLCDTTPTGLKAILEHGVALLGNQGRFPQIGGIRFAFDPALAAGSRVRSIVTIDQDENITGRVVEDGVVVPEAPAFITLVTLNFLAQGGDGYPFKANADNFRFLLDNGTLSLPVDESLDFAGATVVPANLLREQAALSSHLAVFHATPAAAYDLADTAPALDTRIQSLAVRADAVALGSVTLEVWLADNGFANGDLDTDSDGLIDLQEFAFGLNPNASDSGWNKTDVPNGLLLSRGTPAIYAASTGNGEEFRVVFIRRKNPASVGLTYVPQFSSDMTGWEASTAIPTVVARDGDVEAVSIPYPILSNGQNANFFRLGVSEAP